MPDYETVIGLEVHVQIKTESKLFCSCPTHFGSDPNTQLCPICAGYPGVLPVLNKKAVESLIKTALALDCEVKTESIFARKQYFYPDLPKNYQISQYEKPLAENGTLEIVIGDKTKKVRIKRIHLEEDAGKLLHSLGARELPYSLVDFNRTGIPLMEIVSEPDLSSPEEAHAYLSSLKQIIQYLGVSDCDMEKGSMRCDANISLRPKGSTTLGPKVELKNMNSFKGVMEALKFEIQRQREALRQGEPMVQETRLWNEQKAQTRALRSKEEAHDYRYFPEPDLLPLLIDSKQIESLRRELPELPNPRKNRLMRELQLSPYDAAVLTAERLLADYFEKTLSLINEKFERANAAKLLSNWLTTELLGKLNAEGKTIEKSPVSPEQMAALVELILSETISGKIGKTVFEEMWKCPKNPRAIVEEKKLVQVKDQAQIEHWAEEAIAQNRKAAEEFKAGKERALGALVGAVMKLSKGSANPQLVNEILKSKLTSAP